jgi:hypothetical protein
MTMDYTSGLGADPTQFNDPLTADFFPTDAQRTGEAMSRLIDGRFGYAPDSMWKMLNLDLARVEGWSGGPIKMFLSDLIAWERVNQTSVDASNMDAFLATVPADKYTGRGEDRHFYVDAYLSILDQGLVPASIQKPWTSAAAPGSLAADVGREVGAAMKNVVVGAGAPVMLLLLAGVAIYAGVGLFLPNYLHARVKQRA